LDQKTALVIIDLQKGMTARHAHELGFHVALAVDAMTDLNLDAHNHSVTRIFPRLGENGTTHEILDLLKKRFE
jgi:nicotinamidase-related amidase